VCLTRRRISRGALAFSPPSQFASPDPCLPRALRALAHEAVVTEDGPHPTVRGRLTAQPDTYRVILSGRATSVPLTTVLTGLQRTTTDNATARSTSAGRHPRRWQQRPNWLWEQGVGARGYRPDVMGRRPAQITLPGRGVIMDLTASQAADQAATVLQGLDADTKKAGDQAAVARAWLDLARYLREQENSTPSVPHPSEPGKRIHPDAVVG
jgi:hypothetical protein